MLKFAITLGKLAAHNKSALIWEGRPETTNFIDRRNQPPVKGPVENTGPGLPQTSDWPWGRTNQKYDFNNVENMRGYHDAVNNMDFNSKIVQPQMHIPKPTSVPGVNPAAGK